MSDRRLRGHPTMVAKYDAEGRERPIDRFEGPRAVPLHYREHSDTRVALGPDGYPALHHEALDLITAGGTRDAAAPRPRSWLTVAEVARILELDEHIIRRAIARGAFPAEQPTGQGGLYRIRPARLEAHLYATGHAHEQIREWARTWTAWLAESAARDA